MRVIIADAQPVFRRGLRGILDDLGGAEVVAEVDEGRAAVAAANRERLDLAIVDTCLSGLDGLATIRELRAVARPPTVLALSAHRAPRVVVEALQAGALGLVLKTDPDDILLAALRAVARGAAFLSPQLDQRLAAAAAEKGPPALGALAVLTARQRVILRLVLNGSTTEQIAASLCISPKTVDTHRGHINRKLRCSSPSALIRFAAVNGLLEELEPCPLPARPPASVPAPPARASI